MQTVEGSKNWLDGNVMLRRLLDRSEYGSAEQTVAALTQWSHPDTVAQTQSRALFPIVRCRNVSDRGSEVTIGDRTVMQDDNTGPTDAFLYANGLSRSYRDAQFNHLWPVNDADTYTSLANLCVTPSFLAKLTDTDSNVCAVLRFRAFKLYGYAPRGVPVEPHGYEALGWADLLPPVTDLEAAMRGAMRGKDSRTVRCARRLGWLFSGFAPDASL